MFPSTDRLLLACCILLIGGQVHHACSAASTYEDQFSIRTLSPSPEAEGVSDVFERTNIRVADALLSDWEGKHWASLDADMDKVALSWTTDKEYITFQVKRLFPIDNSVRLQCFFFLINI